MKEKKKRIDYLYLSADNSQNKRGIFGKWITCQRKNVAGIECLQVNIGGERKNEQIKKKIQRELGKYETEGCVIGADAIMAQKMQIADNLFSARKRELVKNGKKIFRWLRGGREQNQRGSLLLVINSDKWNRKELICLLSAAKNEYEDLYVVLHRELPGLERITEVMYDEWGVVVHVLSRGEAERLHIDTVLFLVETWEGQMVEKYTFQNAYVLAEMEEGMGHGRAESFDGRGRGAKKIYSGLAYQKERVEIPYDMGVNIAYQNPVLYEDFGVSCIAIYRLKWYNKEQK